MSLSRKPDGWHELDATGRPGPALGAQLLLLVAVFLLQAPLGLERWAVLSGDKVWPGLQLWRLLSYASLHQDWLHLLFNLLGLYVFGAELERLWGRASYWTFTLVCAAGAGVVHLLLDGWLTGRPAAVVGASGVVYGLMAAYGLLFRERRLYFLGLIPVKAGLLALGFGALALVSGVLQSSDGMAHFAHLGGMATGLLLLHAGWLRSQWRFWRQRRRMLRHLKRASAAAAAAGPPLPEEFRAGDEAAVEARLDDLLGKVSREGLGALDARERAFLDEASRWLKARRTARP